MFLLEITPAIKPPWPGFARFHPEGGIIYWPAEIFDDLFSRIIQRRGETVCQKSGVPVGYGK